MSTTVIETTDRRDEGLRAELLDLLGRVTRAEGHAPVGEHKYAQLEAGTDGGAAGWTGVLARDGHGRLLGYAHVRWSPPGSEPRAAVECAFDPSADAGAVGTRLLAEVEGVVAGAGGGLLWLWVHRVVDATATLPARLGWRVQRELAFMTRRLDERPDPGQPPAGVLVGPYRGEVDDAEFLRVNNAAFEGHPENGGWDRAEFAARRARDWFDAEGLLMAWRGDVLLGFHWTKRHGPDSGELPGDGPVGEVYVLAVDPAAAGLRLGRHLLGAGLAHLYDRGCRETILYVDTASARPLRLYTAAGFAVAHREVCYERRVPAAREGPPR